MLDDEGLEQARGRRCARCAAACGTSKYSCVGRVDDAVGGERVEDVDAVVVALDHRCEIVDAALPHTLRRTRAVPGTRRRRDRSARRAARPSRARASTRDPDARARSARRRRCRTRFRRARSCRRRAPGAARRCPRRRRRSRRTAAGRRSSPHMPGPPRRSAGRDPTSPSAAASPRSRARRRRCRAGRRPRSGTVCFSAASALSTKRSRIGSPGWPGPPASTSSTPCGALTLSAAPTRRCSVPLRRPVRSSGTSSVEHV